MSRTPVDLASHLNYTVERGHPADFPVSLKPIAYLDGESLQPVPKRLAVVRDDTGDTLGVVSDRYALVPHQRILDVIQAAIAPLEVGPVPRGIYVDRGGARMRAVYKFPALAQPVVSADTTCPCLQIRNTYDGTARIALHIGAFRFVCTNLAVGGGGVFAGGFMSIHAGEIPIEQVGEQLRQYLSGFDRIVALYRAWRELRTPAGSLQALFEGPLQGRPAALWPALETAQDRSVYDAYNAATDYATHRMRSPRTAFELLERINQGFQESFPVRIQ